MIDAVTLLARELCPDWMQPEGHAHYRDVLKSLKVLAKSRLISKAEATTVIRPENGPWKWPEVASAMISDSMKVQGADQTIWASAANGDPLTYAYAVNFLDSLYRCGYAIVDTRKPDEGKEPQKT